MEEKEKEELIEKITERERDIALVYWAIGFYMGAILGILYILWS